MKSAKRNKNEGAIDKVAGAVLEMVGKVTGKGSTQAKGKAAKGRGFGRSSTGRARSGGR